MRQGRRIPLAAQLAALATEEDPHAIAEFYGISTRSVDRVRQMVGTVDISALSGLKEAKEPLLNLLAVKMTANALKWVDSNAQKATRYAFGAKLATEAARIAAPQASQPASIAMAFVQHLHVGSGQESAARPCETAPVDAELVYGGFRQLPESNDSEGIGA